jgi:hypothetical protein
MGNEKVKAADHYGVGLVGGGSNAFVVGAPFLAMDVDCYGPDGFKWAEKMHHNVVVDQGKGHLLNVFLGSGRASTQGAAVFLHSATTASNRVWSDISASQVISYGASMPAITFTSNYAAGLATGSVTYGFSASTQTVSGAGLLFYTSASIGTNAASADLKLYAYGTFANSRQVQSADTLNVTLSISLA